MFKLVLLLISLLIAQDPILPDSILTPGVALDVPLCTLCTPGYTATVRNVPSSLRKKVFKEYGIVNVPYRYEVDHLISLELGGDNDIKNLWPESYLTATYNAHRKDVLENKLHTLVCSQQMKLQEAQYLISHNWIKAYEKYCNGDTFSGSNIPRIK